ncbi:MAG: hypothetical protein KAT62_05025 [Desulfuromonadales bacterium]|nr:hypothetical protein [Desulfuromonadales bacterium]
MAMFSALGTSVKKLPGLIFLLSMLFSPQTVFAGPYADSAHGNTVYGVERTTLAALVPPYLQGNCGHCHEQHTAVADGHLLLADSFSGATTNPYSQSDSACFACHVSVASLQTGGGITNNNYAATFGGATATTTDIMAAFNQDSYHNLYDIQRYITGASGTKSFTSFPTGSNPCSGCHNVHIAKANKRSPGDPTLTAISKPSDHDNLFGDDSPGERMSDTIYNSKYQPPYYVGSSNLEPDGLSTDRATQAAKTPDYNEFCTDCHNSTNTIYSTTLGRNLRTIDWDNEKHGKGNADSYITVDGPFTPASGSLGYVLACTDCHEPHGSPNAFLIRKEVNGGVVGGSITSFSDIDWHHLCDRCHQDDKELYSSCQEDHHYLAHHSATYGGDLPYSLGQCKNCHTGDKGSSSCTSSFDKIVCTNCHFHGSWVNDPANPLDKTPNYAPTTRTTF